MPTRVIVIVSGGNVQHCYADSAEVEVDVIDFDNIEDEGKDAVDRAEAQVQAMTKQMHHAY